MLNETLYEASNLVTGKIEYVHMAYLSLSPQVRRTAHQPHPCHWAQWLAQRLQVSRYSNRSDRGCRHVGACLLHGSTAFQQTPREQARGNPTNTTNTNWHANNCYKSRGGHLSTRIGTGPAVQYRSSSRDAHLARLPRGSRTGRRPAPRAPSPIHHPANARTHARAHTFPHVSPSLVNLLRRKKKTRKRNRTPGATKQRTMAPDRTKEAARDTPSSSAPTKDTTFPDAIAPSIRTRCSPAAAAAAATATRSRGGGSRAEGKEARGGEEWARKRSGARPWPRVWMRLCWTFMHLPRVTGNAGPRRWPHVAVEAAVRSESFSAISGKLTWRSGEEDKLDAVLTWCKVNNKNY